MSSVNLNAKALETARNEGYLPGGQAKNGRYSYGASGSHTTYCCWGCGRSDPRETAVAVCVIVFFSGIIGATAASLKANDCRLEANQYSQDAKEAQKTGLKSAEKIFTIISTEKRMESAAHGLVATGFALLVIAALGKLVIYYYANAFDQHILIHATIGGGGFLILGGLTYLSSHIYKEKKKAEVEREMAWLQPQPTIVTTTPALSDA